MPFEFMSSMSPTIAFSKDAFPNRPRISRVPDQIVQPAKISLIVLRDAFA
jgi:hypothetical protein